LGLLVMKHTKSVRRRKQPDPALLAEPGHADACRLVQELDVQRVELEAQNAELRAARLAVEALLVRYMELFDFAPLGYAVLAPDDIIREVNHSGARLLEREREALVGAHLGALVAPCDRQVLTSSLQAVREAGDRASCEVRVIGDGSASRSLRFTSTALASEGPATLVAFEDVTDQRVREERLATTERTLRDADRRKDGLLATLSHGLRNPLTPIRSSLFLLGRSQIGEERARRAQVIIERQLTQLTSIVDDLLEIIRISRGKVHLDPRPVELRALVHQTMDAHRGRFEAAQLRLEGRFEPGPFWVNGDHDRLARALGNLLSNAEKFTPPGGRVVVALHRGIGRAVLRVRDTGVGIAPELRAHLFEPFSQGSPPPDREQGGLGLGLAMVKGMVELQGGTVEIASEGLGRGAEVTVSLPMAATAPRDLGVGAGADTGRPRRVLVIDDNRDAAQSLKEVLEVSGHQVETAHDGPSGLERARAFNPDVVICDIGLPQMDGYQVARALRAEEELSGVYLVALTGYNSAEDLQRSVEAGFDRHITKPPIIEDLDRLVTARGRPPEG
jgi:two-component system CheB/CheR fusion protein